MRRPAARVSNDNLVQGNLIGTDASGKKAQGNGTTGVEIEEGSAGNTIGGSTAAARNIIAANGDSGVGIGDAGTTGNLVEGNYIGTDITGTYELGNQGDGVHIDSGSTANTIGGTATGTGNLISGNAQEGVHLDDDGTTGNFILGNKIGTDVTGTADIDPDKNALGNAYWGVYLDDAGSTGPNVPGNMVSGNLVSGNLRGGVAIYGVDAVDDVVQGNDIGTDVTGKKALGNKESGVFVGLWGGSGAATGATIGGTAPGDGNVISANGNSGVWIYGSGANGNLVEGNKIGTDVTGNVALGNTDNGVLIEDGGKNTIGGTTAVPGTGAGNLISGNHLGAVSIEGSDAVGDVVQGNMMGTNAAGTKGLGNATDGVYVAGGASGTLIGGVTTTPGTGAGNVMADNAHFGVHITGQGTTGVVVEGNIIGLNAAGTAKLGNAYDGVLIDEGATKNKIGGVVTGAGNVISGNHEHGVEIDDSTKNLVAGNLIGTDITGLKALGNSESGVLITNDADSNTIGGTAAAARNVLSANGLRGVHIQDHSADNLVEGNDIGTNVSGTPDLGNDLQGVLIDTGSSSNTIGGTASGAGNVIAGNRTDGVELNGAGEHNLIEDDTIDANGTNNSKTNPGDGVYINDSSYTSVIGCTIDTNPGWGILITGSGHVTQQKNSFSGNGKGKVSG